MPSPIKKQILQSKLSDDKLQSMSSIILSSKRKSAEPLKSRAFLLITSILATLANNFLVVLASLCFFFVSMHQLAHAHSLSHDTANALHGSNRHQANSHPNARMSNMLTQTTDSQQSQCQHGWLWFHNKCWISLKSRRDWKNATELCQKREEGSTLPTIHSEEENEYLREKLGLDNPIWLFATHNHQYNTTRWHDKSSVNYTRWDAGQPSDKTSFVCINTQEGFYMRKTDPKAGNTECVSFWEDGKWSTSVGCTVLLPVVCEKKLDPIQARNQDGNSTGPVFNEVTGALSGTNTLSQELNVFVLFIVMSLIIVYQTNLMSKTITCHVYNK